MRDGEMFYDGADYLKEYFLAMPNLADNPLGVRCRACVINRLKVALPGEAVMHMWQNYGRYRNLFYGDSNPMPEQDGLDAATGISAADWGNECVPYVCDTIYNVTSSTRDFVNIDSVRKAEKGLAQLMGKRHAAFYRYLMTAYQNPVKEAWAKLSDAEKKTGKQDYIDAITGTAWVANKAAAQAQGNWPNPDWELYHHWNKLKILGAGDEEVESVISTIRSKGLSIPDQTDERHWQLYDRWMTEGEAAGDPSWHDFKEASRAMNRSTLVGNIEVKEVYSSLFLCDDGPGGKFWKEPQHTSCFGAETFVLLADGNLREISRIRPGDQVATPFGAREVLLISTPLRGKRPLYSFPEHDFRFTATHPFVGRDGVHCVFPKRLIDSITTFREENVETFGVETALLTSFGGEDSPGSPVVHPFLSGKEGELLYDLIPAPGQEGVFRYYAGDAWMQYLVSAEVPSMKGRDVTARAFLDVVGKICGPLLSETASVSDKDFWECISRRFFRYSKFVLPGRITQCQATEGKKQEAVCRKEEPCSESSEPGRIVGSFGALFSDTGMNIRVGLLFAAAFEMFLPIFLQKDLSWEEVKLLAEGIADDIRNGLF